MFRALIALSLVVVACGGADESTDSSIGTIGTTTTTRASTTTTDAVWEPAPLEDFVIAINRMPSGWVLVDDMSGEVVLGDIDASLLDGLDTDDLLWAYRSTFARSGTSEVGALARAGAELIVSIAAEMTDPESAEAGVGTIVDALEAATVSQQSIRTPGPGQRLELTGGIFVLVWSVDEIVQVVIANGVPGTNIANIADLVPDVN